MLGLMLVQLHIVDLAIIEEVELRPGPGLNMLTGETGAGKSIIVGAAALLLGGRASADMVRAGQDEAVVEALFDISGRPTVAQGVEAAGLPDGDGELLVRRVISRKGRGRVHVNGALCTLSVLRDLTGDLLDISGQHEHQRLSDHGVQRGILDAVALKRQDPARMAEQHARLRQLSQELLSTGQDEAHRAQRQEFLTFQLRELERAELLPGEEESLRLERERLQRASELVEVAAQGEETLYSGDGSVTERLTVLSRRLSDLAHLDPHLADLANQLEQAAVQVEDVAHTLRRYGSTEGLDPGRLDQVEERLDLLLRLARKHGLRVEQLPDHQAALEQELDGLATLDHRRSGLEAELEQARGQAKILAGKLERARSKAARGLAVQVSDHLARLRMEGARLQVAVTALAPREGDDPALLFGDRRLGPAGWDRVDLRISTNPGEEPRSLARVASGGELSRVMLALHRVLGERDPISTVIYDEVDAGIGGAVADVVGRYLAEVGRHRQVLCVTHLPQVAAHARHHFHVDKSVSKQGGKARARTRLRTLEAEERVDELARMLGGKRVTKKAQENARELIASAK